jgi:hypothetical protein
MIFMGVFELVDELEPPFVVEPQAATVKTTAATPTMPIWQVAIFLTVLPFLERD